MELKKPQHLVERLTQNDSPARPMNQQEIIKKRHHALISRVWTIMSSHFLQKWAAAGDVDGSVFNEWLNGLKDMSVDQLRTGSMAIRDIPVDRDGKVWPPSLPEFRAMCRNQSSRVQTYSDRNFTQEGIDSGEVKSLKHFGKRKRGDTQNTIEAKKTFNKILAGEDVQTKEESMRVLGMEP